jgi:hypothetical protein
MLDIKFFPLIFEKIFVRENLFLCFCVPQNPSGCLADELNRNHKKLRGIYQK